MLQDAARQSRELSAAVEQVSCPQLAVWMARLLEEAAAKYFHCGSAKARALYGSHKEAKLFMQDIQAGCDVFDSYAFALRARAKELEAARASAAAGQQTSNEVSQKPMPFASDDERKGVVSGLVNSMAVAAGVPSIAVEDVEFKKVVEAMAAAAPQPVSSDVLRPRRALAVSVALPSDGDDAFSRAPTPMLSDEEEEVD